MHTSEEPLSATSSTFLSGPVEAKELSLWPLLHGTNAWAYDEKLKHIKENGLLSSGFINLNSFKHDVSFGRDRFVYMATAGFRFQYSGGWGGFLIDPAVMHEDNVFYSDRDAAESFAFLEIFFEDGEEYVIPESVKNASELLSIARNHPKAGRESDDLVSEVIASPAFGAYIARNYQMSGTALFQSIEEKSKKLTLFEYFSRTGGEEITIESVPPRYILGFCSGGEFTQWNKPIEPTTALRLEAWLEGMRLFRKGKD